MKEPKSEMLEIYDLDGNFINQQERKEFYKEIYQEYKDTGKITRQVRVVRFLLMTSVKGRIYIQKRSRTKSENPGLYDKTVGGHVKAGYTDDTAAFIECQEELAIPVLPLPEDEFETVLRTSNLGISGIMQKLGQENGLISIRRSSDGSFIEQPVIASFYIGYYDGSIRFQDGESAGVETFNLDEIERLVRDEPEKCTDDLKDMIQRFKDYLVPLKDYRKPQANK